MTRGRSLQMVRSHRRQLGSEAECTALCGTATGGEGLVGAKPLGVLHDIQLCCS
jgi:hypothetical protein